ncbi:hypothetical protein F7984_07755 [Pradoshia sp. D12]|jgi:hypothetical protein|nr:MULTISPECIES: hypothetical protein [unclassified Bacillus (in: firmicutes)]OCA89469.1 hypothetical protein A8L44_00505 [Bacillus sp. FJAT-27986]QFK71147.1 hypothetical protein F7984_07755 [Pradoshia sp. D12]TPF72940.1 hypothetical protein FHY44_04145 [Bacillus sp. D12]
MIGLLIEYDYDVIQQTLIIAFLFSVVFPLAALFIVHKQNKVLFSNHYEEGTNQPILKSNKKQPIIDKRHIQRFFTLFRIKVNPGDKESSHFHPIV